MDTRAYLNADPLLARKAAFFERFWEGRGPYPILFAKPHLAKGKNWLRRSISEQHADPGRAIGELGTAVGFYRLLMERVEKGIAPLPYAPDNQGVFDISRIVVGTDLFYGPADDPGAVHAAQKNSLSLYVEGTRFFKSLIREENGSMLHGHGAGLILVARPVRGGENEEMSVDRCRRLRGRWHRLTNTFQFKRAHK